MLDELPSSLLRDRFNANTCREANDIFMSSVNSVIPCGSYPCFSGCKVQMEKTAEAYPCHVIGLNITGSLDNHLG